MQTASVRPIRWDGRGRAREQAGKKARHALFIFIDGAIPFPFSLYPEPEPENNREREEGGGWREAEGGRDGWVSHRLTRLASEDKEEG